MWCSGDRWHCGRRLSGSLAGGRAGFWFPVRVMRRTTTHERHHIPDGHWEMLLSGSVNRDERQYGSDDGELGVQQQCRELLTFSRGVNRCLGWVAARLQSRVAVTELLARRADFDVEESGVVWASSSHVRRPVSVPFRVG